MKSRNLMLAGLGATALTTAMTLATGALAQAPQDGSGYGYHPHMWSGYGDGGWAHGMFAGPLMVLVIIIVLAVVVMGVARMAGCTGGRCGRHGHSSSTALAVLEERFAKGEIDKTEFEERKNTLKSR